jgi:hypothetical protein
MACLYTFHTLCLLVVYFHKLFEEKLFAICESDYLCVCVCACA